MSSAILVRVLRAACGVVWLRAQPVSALVLCLTLAASGCGKGNGAPAGGDQTPPHSRITIAPAAVINQTSATIAFDATDDVTPPDALVFAFRLDAAAFGSFSRTTSVALTGLLPGAHTFEVKARDLAGNEEPKPIAVSFRVNRPPGVTLTAPTLEGPAPLTVSFSATASDPDGDALSLSWTFGDGTSVTGAAAQTHRYEVAGAYAASVRVSDGYAAADANVSVTVNAAAEGPPDPATVAPPADLGVATDLKTATEFLYSGANPIQVGVVAGTIEMQRAAIIRGRVLRRDTAPLAGVGVSVLGHREFGGTSSRADGRFDLVVNGGGLLTLDFQKPGFLPAQRQLRVEWQEYAIAPEVVLIPLDAQVTAVELGAASMQVAQGSLVSDAAGDRHASVLFPAGTSAAMTLPDGTTRPLTGLHVRATEYTVGPQGPSAMPASLPPTSGYTYAVELSADEAIAGGATSVRFNQPVVLHVENFLQFPVGSPVPVGAYDRERVAWVPVPNGRVIRITAVNDGRAEVDTVGAGSSPALALDEPELRKLGSLYTAGQTLWRVPIAHFSIYDCNWPYGPPPCQNPRLCAGPPPAGPFGPYGGGNDNHHNHGPNDDCRNPLGSTVSCYAQTLGEDLAVTGTPFKLHYDSERVPGRKQNYQLRIPVSGETLSSPPPKRIELEVQIAGTVFHKTFAPATNLTEIFEWDGRDAYGRALLGWQTVSVHVGNVYDAVYRAPADVQQSFGLPGDVVVSSDRARQEVTLATEWKSQLARHDSRIFNLAGWSLSAHHLYDPAGRLLLQGYGGQRAAAGTTALTTFAGGSPNDADGLPAIETRVFDLAGLVVAPDGTVYFAENGNLYPRVRIRKVGPDGIVHPVAGTGDYGFSGDGGPALLATFARPTDLALGPDGSLYVADDNNLRVRKIGPDGIVTTVAGNGQYGYSGDGGPAVLATFGSTRSIAVAPDGSLYIMDPINARVRRVAPDGTIDTIAGAGVPSSYEGDEGPARQAHFNQPDGVALGPDGSVYVADTMNHAVRRITPDGVIHAFAGTGTSGAEGDGGPATLATLTAPTRVTVGRDGSVYIAEIHRLRVVDPDGIISTIAGGGRYSDQGVSGGPPPTSLSVTPLAVALGRDGTPLFADSTYGFRILRRAPSLRGLSGAGILVAAENQQEVYVFDGGGRHLATLDQLSGALRFQFGYDAKGRLISIADGDGNQTLIERDASGQPVAIVSPGNQRTHLIVNGDGYLSRITGPGGEAVDFSYGGAGGLLVAATTARGHLHRYGYDDVGRLVRDENPGGAAFTLSRREVTASRYVVSLSSPAARTTTYDFEAMTTGDIRRVRTDPGGGRTEVLSRADGTRHTAHPDGTVVEEVDGPDPRWGMQSPLLKILTVTTPGGARATRTATRIVQLADPKQIFSLKSQTDTFTINGSSFSAVYDAATRTLSSVTAAGRHAVETQDVKGHVTQDQFDGLVPITFRYDGRGRLAQAQHGSQSWTYAYDASLRLASRTDAAGARIAYGYDAAGHLNEFRSPGDRTYRFDHDASGNLARVTMPSLAPHLFDYSTMELEAGYTPPGSPPYARSYLPDRRLWKVTLPTGRVETHSYDAAGRPAGIDYPEASVALSYAATDPTGRIATLVRTPSEGQGQQTLGFGYDGDLVTGFSASGVANGSYAFAYDGTFRVRSATLTSGVDAVTTNLARDRDGLITGLGPFTIVRGGPFGAATQIGDGTLSIAIAYDSLGRAVHRTESVAGTVIYTSELSFDRAGRLTGKSETVAGASRAYTYRYDADGELLQLEIGGVAAESYTYDANRNRASRQLGATAAELATYDVQDRLIRQGSVDHRFDDDGNLVERGSDRFQYSAAGELLQATAGGKVVRYAYDGFGRRVARLDDAGTTQYLYGNPDEQLQVTHSRSAAGILSTYFYDDSGKLFAFERGGSRYYVATDQLGSPRAIAGPTGAILRTVDYDGFGNVTADGAPDFDLPIGYAAGLADPVTGLVRFGFRDYDPVSGRWTARDPALFAGRQSNLYAYVDNNPVALVDPGGFTSLGYSAYGGLGGGFKLSFDENGISLCGEVGVGVGSSVEVDVFEDADDSSVGLIAEVEGGAPLVARAKLKGEVLANFSKLSPGDCTPTGEAKVEGKICLTVLCGGGELSTAEDPSKRLGLDGPGPDEWKELKARPKDLFKAGIQGKLAAKACQKKRW